MNDSYNDLKDSVAKGFRQIEAGQFTEISSKDELVAMAREKRSLLDHLTHETSADREFDPERRKSSLREVDFD